MEIEEQLRSESDQMLDAIDRLRTLEGEKRIAPPNNRQFQKLAREVERLADTIVGHAETQTDLGVAAAERHAETGEGTTPIAATPRDVTTILGEWRDAERRAATAQAGSPEAMAAHDEVDRLRAEYQRAHRRASKKPKGSG